MTDTRQPQTALITGAATGIGRCFALDCAARGMTLVLVDINAAALEETAKTIQNNSHTVPYTLIQDMSLPEAAESCLSFCTQHNLAVDLLINNAGIFIFDPFLDTDPDRMEVLIGLHIASVTRMCRLFAAQMKARRFGYILNMSSMSVWMTMPGLNLYNASKAYIRGLSRSLYFELKPFNVSVTTVCPAGVNTSLIPLSDSIRTLAKRLGFLMSPEKLAKKALKAVLKKKIQIIPGALNDIFAFFMMTLPNWLIEFVSHRLSIYKKFWV